MATTVQHLASAVEDCTPSGIAATIARLIRSGELAPGDRLPTVRALAQALGRSPATVSGAFRTLSRVGLVASRGRAGTFVLSQPEAWLPPRELAPPRHGYRLDLSSGTPDPHLLPPLGPALRRLATGCTEAAVAATDSYTGPPLLPDLERAARSSWPFSPGGITVVDGALDAIGRTLALTVGRGGQVVVEDPGFPPVVDLLDVLGIRSFPVAVDAEGLRPEGVRAALTAGAEAVVVQPRAHNPTGASMSRARCAELAGVLRQAPVDVLVVEDDHSAGIATAPPVSLGAHLSGQVVHVRSYSTSHGPELRAAVVGGPARLLDRLVARRMLGPGWTSRILQTLLVDLLTDGTAIAAVHEARRAYDARQRSVAAALDRAGVPVLPGDGINLWLPVRDEVAALTHLAAHGILVAPGGPFRTGVHHRQEADHVRVTVGRIRQDLEGVSTVLARAALA